jgi:hypothetical protein
MSRFTWSALGAVLAAAAIAGPASAQQLVFDITVTDYKDYDINANVLGTTALNLQYSQVFTLSGLPAPGSSVYQAIDDTVHDLHIHQNIVQTGGLTAGSAPLDPAIDAIYTPSDPLQQQQVEFSEIQDVNHQGAQYNSTFGASLQMQYQYATFNDDFTHATGGDRALGLAFGTQTAGGFIPDPTPLTINQMLGLMAGQTWTFNYTEDAYDLTFSPDDGSVTGGTYASRGYEGFATLDLSQSSMTPEPGTWALMMLGFGAVGASLRRRRTAVAA